MGKFRGAFTALVTPMRGGEVDDAALCELVEAQITAGIDGLVPCGTTGESATLSLAEQLHVIDTVVKTTRGRVPVLAGAGSNNTQTAIDTTRACHELGVDGTLQVTPYYSKPPPAGLLAHFRAIADAAPLPVVLYNVPGRTASDLSAKLVAELAKHPRIVGIKEATGDMGRASEIRELCGHDFDLLSGDDFSLLPFLAGGGDGVVSVVSNVLPGTIADLCRAARDDDWHRAKHLHRLHLPLTRALFAAPNPIPVKAAMALRGHCTADVRLPLVPLQDDSPEMSALRVVLDTLRKEEAR
ncbi:MAG TPA: 4-hydroxy-tetrahydrodipicolinate synthase [Nannocystis exedens]|nr:4-hydroxy-tetrahydrodipicolinate synthase [Nannocystis exedens]